MRLFPGATGEIERRRSVMCLWHIIAYLSLILTPFTIHAALSYNDVILHFHGEDSLARAGVFLGPIGDINGDSFDDIYLHVYSPDPGCHIFFGGDPVDTMPDLWIPDVWRLESIDVTGDGINDLVGNLEANKYPPYNGRIYFFRGFGDSISTTPFDSIHPETELYGNVITNWSFGQNFEVAYVDDDDLGDIVLVKDDPYIGPFVYYYSGAPTIDTVCDWAYQDSAWVTIIHVGFIDYNGDGYLDIYVGKRTCPINGDVGYVEIFKGPNFGNLPDWIIEQPTDIIHNNPCDFASLVTNVGDLNSDGYDDLGVINYNHPLVYFGGPDADTLYDLHFFEAGFKMASGGDINDDGYDDLLIGDGQTAYGIMAVYLGGPRLDTTLDDYLVRGHLPPIFIDQIGYTVSQAGDFNGDGIDDFMFKSENFSGGEPNDVWVVRGSQNIVVPVNEGEPAELPSRPTLNQNYPNPFNPSTTIAFELPVGQHVKLEVFNVLGQKVETLIDQFLPAGVHKVTWDVQESRNPLSGTQRVVGFELPSIPSGIYLYRLKGEGINESRKMVLLK